MEQTTKSSQLFSILAIVCGIWFLLTCWLWVYFANLFISFPVGLLAVFFWNKARKTDPANKLNRISLIILIAGAIVSLGSLIVLLIWN